MSTLGRRLKMSVNPKLIDKNVGGDRLPFANGWENVELTPGELAESIQRGVAYCVQPSGSRKAAHFVASDIVSVDINGTMTIEQALMHPIVSGHATLVYTTARHRPDAHRFRIVFALPHTITSPQEIAAAARSLSLRLAGDPAAVDAARLFYGCGARP
jgi:hypothetical protein